MEEYILGIDQGTTGTRVVVFDRAASIVGSAYSEFTQHFPEPGWVEHDANEIWEVFKKVAEAALKDAGVSPADLKVVGIANQRSTTALWDRETGEPATRAIVWMDRRGQEFCEHLKAKDQKGIEDRTGMVIIPNTLGIKLHVFMKNFEEVRRGIDDGRLIAGTMDTWMVFKLSGGAAHITDHSNASSSLLHNARSLDWDEESLKEFGVPRSILPELKESSEIYAYTDPDAFFGVRVPIAGVAGDQQAATLGQACVRPGMVKNTYGTGIWMLINTGSKYVPAQKGMKSPVLCTVKGETTYAIEGGVDVGGAAVQWLRDGLGIIRDAAEAEQLANEVEDTLGVYFVPAFAGLRVPIVDGYARGSMFGITRGTTKNHIARATLESMAYQTRDCVSTMEELSGVRLESLRVDGGAARSDFVCQFQADILGLPVDRPVITEATVLGAAYLAGTAVGVWDSLEEIAEKWKLERRFEPKMSGDRREELYCGWEKARNRSAGWLKDP
jgi:glycerol kinase